MIDYSMDKNQDINWNEVGTVFLQAPLGKRKRHPDKLKRVFGPHKVVGSGRALCDAEYQASIYDIVLLSGHQGKGVRKEIMKKLCD